MKQTVAAFIAKTLEQAGVKQIWGVTGDSLNGLSDSLNRMMDANPPRRGRRFRRRRTSAAYRRAGSVRRFMWTGQPAPDQWPV